MPARTGAQYIAGLKDRGVEIYVSGERVKDVTTHPGLSNGVHSIARLYDLQHAAAADDQMTFASPTSGDPVGLSFVTPKTPGDLDQRHAMMRRWAQSTCGMMGRTPDFMNVTMMAMAAAGDYFAQNRPEFKNNIQNYFEYIR